MRDYVLGRVLIDESNTFFYGETSLDGVFDLVSRSKKSVQFPEHNAGTLVAEGFLDDTVRYTVEDVCHVRSPVRAFDVRSECHSLVDYHARARTPLAAMSVQ
jgi:hypothetical protein